MTRFNPRDPIGPWIIPLGALACWVPIFALIWIATELWEALHG
jgi:hypothetical protein